MTEEQIEKLKKRKEDTLRDLGYVEDRLEEAQKLVKEYTDRREILKDKLEDIEHQLP